MSRVLPAVLSVAATALATTALAQDTAPGGIDLMAIVTGLLGTVNVPVLVMLTVIAGALHRAQRVTATQAITWPMAIGAAFGALSAITEAQQTAGGWLMVAQLSQAVVAGAIVNGGMAVVVGRIASAGLEKLWPAAPS